MKTFIYKFSLIWWCFWSQIRFRKSVKNNIGINEEDKVTNLKTLKSLLNRLYSKFTYTKDGIDQLNDAITPPPQNYQYYLNGEVKDDCDGFASLVYHCLYNSNIQSYLLTVQSKESGHCVNLFKYKDKWYISDYNSISKGFITPTECIESYNKSFPLKYDKTVKSEVVFNGIVSYVYNLGCFKIIDLKNLK